MYYEELRGGEWRRLDLDGEMLVGRAHHVIYFGSRESWSQGPEWARGRRDEIIARIKSAVPIPDYEYEGEDVLDDHDRELLIKAAGGLSSDHCGWMGCKNLARRPSESVWSMQPATLRRPRAPSNQKAFEPAAGIGRAKRRR